MNYKSLRTILISLSLIISIQLTTAHLSAQKLPAAPVIQLQFATFDPLAGEPQIAPRLQATIARGGTTTYLVQFSAPVLAEWKNAVEQTGARLYDYIPDYAFIARMDAATAQRVRALPMVRWVGYYHPAYRLAADLAPVNTETITVTVKTLPKADLTALAQRITTWGGAVHRQTITALAGYVRVTLPATRLEGLARQDEVLWVEPYFDMVLYNDESGGDIMRGAQVRTDLGLYGAGQIVAVADSGLDVGTTGAGMSADFAGRIVDGQAICTHLRGGRTTWNDFDGHGTHVVGSVLGSGVLSGSEPANHQYADSFAGVAPEAHLVFQAVDNSPDDYGILECISEDLYTDIFQPAYLQGARIHTNSWGGPTGGTMADPEYGGYDDFAQIVDDIAWRYPEMLILYAAGNAGIDRDRNGVVDADSISSPGTAKNVLTVGATESERPHDFAVAWRQGWPESFPADPVASDMIANNRRGMAAFSSRGPTDDGRIKPDVVAPGTAIISARSHDPLAGVSWGRYDEHYVYMGGTSMSTPLTAGAAALVREWLTRFNGVVSPSSALLKAMLINGAVAISPGQYGHGDTQEIPFHHPNNVSGWGRVDLGASLAPTAPRDIWFVDNSAGLSTGETANYDLRVGGSTMPGADFRAVPTEGISDEDPPDMGGELRISLVWTDYPGSPAAARALVNDLDLEVSASNGQAYYGNQGLYTGGQCLRAARWDTCNNVEGVRIPLASPGVYRVTVYGTNIPEERQPFAVVASGIAVQEVPATATPVPSVSPTSSPLPSITSMPTLSPSVTPRPSTTPTASITSIPPGTSIPSATPNSAYKLYLPVLMKIYGT